VRLGIDAEAPTKRDVAKFRERWDELDLVTRRIELPKLWSRLDFPCAVIKPDVWVRLFREIGYTCDVPGYELPSPGRVEIFRGSTWGRRRGLSWTFSAEQAEWFAKRFSRFAGQGRFRPAYVFETEILVDGVLAVIATVRDGEQEVVVDPNCLPPIRRPHGMSV
jgi:hypothetical protein